MENKFILILLRQTICPLIFILIFNRLNSFAFMNKKLTIFFVVVSSQAANQHMTPERGGGAKGRLNMDSV